MPRILILGANGQIAHFAIEQFLQNEAIELTLYLRKAKRMQHVQSNRVQILEGDVLDQKMLDIAMAGQDVVYANLSGDMEQQAKNIVAAMHKNNIKRLILSVLWGFTTKFPAKDIAVFSIPIAIQSLSLKHLILTTPSFDLHG